MKIPVINYISRKEFEDAEGIYTIITDEITHTHVCFELNNNKYYIGYSSNDIIKVDFMILEKENYLLVGVDLKVVVLCIRTGSILFSLGLFSYFKGFEDKDELSFKIFTELDDYVISKNRLCIAQTIPHELEY